MATNGSSTARRSGPATRMMAEWGFFLVRTDPTVKPQRGISFLLIRMDTPGLTVRPIVSIEGGTGLNEVFLENVRVPRENLVGEPGMGWTYAKYLLEKERTASAFLYFNKRELEKAREIARGQRVDGAAPDRPARVRAQAGARGGRRARARVLGAARAVAGKEPPQPRCRGVGAEAARLRVAAARDRPAARGAGAACAAAVGAWRRGG